MILDGLNKMIADLIAEQSELVALKDEESSVAIGDMITAARKTTTKEFAKVLKNIAPQMLKEQRASTEGFERRNFKRWRKPFNHLEMMIVMAIEIGSDLDADLRADAQVEEDFVFEALSQLHPRGILIAQEVFCLLKGGYPDGALARWRSLHEVAVTAAFIAQHEQQIALNYLGSFAFNAKRAAIQLNCYADRAGLDPFDSDELDAMDDFCEATKAQIGRRIGRDFDWAREAIEKDPKSKISLLDIENDVGMDHWRPRYRWASQHTHAGHRPPDKALATSESDEPAHIVGSSNSGFVDPLQMTAITLANLTSTFLLHEATFEQIVLAEIVLKFSHEMGPLALREERRTFERHKKKIARNNPN